MGSHALCCVCCARLSMRCLLHTAVFCLVLRPLFHDLCFVVFVLCVLYDALCHGLRSVYCLLHNSQCIILPDCYLIPPTSPRHAGTLAASRLAYLPICSSICMTADSAVRAPEKVTTSKVAESSSPCDIFFFFWPAPLYSKAFLDLERCMGQYSLSHFPFSSFFLFCPSDCVLLAGYRPDLNLPCFALPCLALLHYLLLFIVFSSRLVRHARLALY